MPGTLCIQCYIQEGLLGRAGCADLSQNDDSGNLKGKEDSSGNAKTENVRTTPASPSQRTVRTSAKQKSDRGWWVGGFLVGFAIGLALSLTYGWVLDPRPRPIGPDDLRAQDKELYLLLIALAFAHDEDEAKAQARLATLEDVDIEGSIVALTERYIEEENDVRDIMALISLSRAMGQTTSVMAAFIATPIPVPTSTSTLAPTPTPRPTQTPTPLTPIPTATSTRTPRPSPTTTSTPTQTSTRLPTRTPTPSRTPTSTNTPTPGPDAPFGVAQSVVLCDDTTKVGLLRIYVRDRLNAGVPGVKVTITWSGGQDTLFTGFKPEIDPGYADFEMEPGQRYQIELANVETIGEIPDITIDSDTLCPNLPDDVDPSWQIVFQQGVSR